MPIQIEGYSRVNRLMQHTPTAIRKSADELMSKNSKEVLEIVKIMVPVRTGRLKRSYRRGHEAVCRWSIKSAVPYAGFVEYGTVKMNAQPHVRPAVEWGEKQMESTVRVLIEKMFEVL
ncbi:MAG: hypothetical protein QM398_08215 [Thermoproteota archaeon]|nr:hypothetical protein [Thermoproteota archaeon]